MIEFNNLKKKRITQSFLLVCVLSLILVSCKKNETSIPAKLSAVVLFTVGDVSMGDKKLKAGDIILENQVVQTGKNSACDIQIRESDSGIVMRMKADSVFQIQLVEANGKQTVNTLLTAGKTLVNIPTKLKNNENFHVITPTSTAGVRGTKFEVEVSKDGSTNYSVTEGKIATKIRLAQIENIPQAIQEKSVTLAAINTAIASEEKILEVGQKTSIEKSQTDKILKEAGVAESISKVNFKDGYTPTIAEIQSSVDTLDKNQKKSDSEKESLTKTLRASSTINIQTDSQQNLQTRLKEYAELISIEKKKLESYESTKLAVKERNQKYDEMLVKRIEEITGKSFETLILKNGNKVRGVIFLEANQYYVITPDGQETFKEEEVESVEL